MYLAIARKGISGFIAFTLLLALSSALAIYVYTYATGLYSVYRPRQGYVYGYAVCYNVTGLRVVLPGNTTVCTPRSQGFSSTPYLCILKAGSEMDLLVVYKDRVEHLHINGSCISLLGDRPFKFLGNDDGMSVVFEVKYYDTWTK